MTRSAIMVEISCVMFLEFYSYLIHKRHFQNVFKIVLHIFCPPLALKWTDA